MIYIHEDENARQKVGKQWRKQLMTDINYSRFPTSAKSIFLTFFIYMLRNDGYDRVESKAKI